MYTVNSYQTLARRAASIQNCVVCITRYLVSVNIFLPEHLENSIQFADQTLET